jgi:hypothetical protein
VRATQIVDPFFVQAFGLAAPSICVRDAVTQRRMRRSRVRFAAVSCPPSAEPTESTHRRAA